MRKRLEGLVEVSQVSKYQGYLEEEISLNKKLMMFLITNVSMLYDQVSFPKFLDPTPEKFR